MSFSFKDAFSTGCILLHLESDTKEAIIVEMIDALVQKGGITDRAAALSAVLDRERKMSTGMQYGVAIPHGKTDTVGNLVTAFALKKEGVDFAALDGGPSRIFIMTISSPLRAGPHIQYLSEISKVLSSESVRNRLLEAVTREEIIEIVTGSQAPVKDQSA